ncbi:MAG: ornithine carbamoyltransferase [Nitrospiraceae bacterium]
MPRSTRTSRSLPPLRHVVKDLLSLGPVPSEYVYRLLTLAAELKALRVQRKPHPRLAGRTLGLLFQKASTRTRVSFEVGMNQLGGQALFLPIGDIQLSRGESVADTARVLSRYLDGIVIRTFDQAIVEEWAREATIPIINGLTDLHHPCQALSDLLTIQEKKKRLKGLRLAYVGDGNNMAHSLIEAAAKVGMHISLGCPRGYQPDPTVVERARQDAARTGSRIEVTEDPESAVSGADAVYTDVWISMGQEREQARRLKAFSSYQVNERLMKRARPDAIVLHCLPAHRGEEISAAVLDGPQSVVLDQAENRLHIQKAILVELVH